MGQYYKPTCIDKMENICAHDYDNGLKLMEHSYIGNSFVKEVEKLLSPGGRWHKTRFCWAGDYTEGGLFLPEGYPIQDEKGYDINIYTVSEEIKPKKEDLSKRRGKFLVNHTKEACLDLSKEISKDENSFIIHPLPLLTSTSNGQGGGDYHGTYMNIVGSWMGDVISIEHKAMFILNKPINFKEYGDNDIEYKFTYGTDITEEDIKNAQEELELLK